MKRILCLSMAILCCLANPIYAEDVLKVKGLFLGMKISDARDILHQKLKEVIGKQFEIIKQQDGTFALKLEGHKKEEDFADRIREIASEFDRGADNGIPAIEADENQNVKFIRIGPALSDKLFNTADLSANDFVQQFVKAYNLPSMKPFQQQFGDKVLSGWEYLSPLGYRLRIYESKSINIKIIPKQTERVFN